MITSGKVRDAFDVTKEPDRVRARYGDQPFRVINQECNVVRYHDVAHPGRALAEAAGWSRRASRWSRTRYHDWDHAPLNFTTLRQLLPPLRPGADGPASSTGRPRPARGRGRW